MKKRVARPSQPIEVQRFDVKADAQANLSDFFGYLRRPGGPTLTFDEMNEVIADGWAGSQKPS